jgi:hypothetical protein
MEVSDMTLEDALDIVSKATGKPKLVVLAESELRYVDAVIALAEENGEQAALKSAQAEANLRKANPHHASQPREHDTQRFRQSVFRRANPQPKLKGLTLFGG